MKRTLLLVLFFTTLLSHAQIGGIVTDSKGTPLPYVNIYLENTYTGTTSNEEGVYTLDVIQPQTYTIVYQFLGFKTVTKTVEIAEFPYQLDVQMEEESVSLDAVVIDATEDPAYRIIRATIAERKKNLERIAAYTADFYSRGLWRVKDVPEKILGQEVGDFGGQLDSTRSGIIYLSETISKIAYQRPSDFKETIIASKVSGNDNGFSFNSARDANFSFYRNTTDINAKIVSPIANDAFNYYRYKLDGVFYEGSKLINKIIVTPKRPKDRVWKGIIYIVEDDWQLYGVELTTTGEAIQVPMVKELIFKQNFTFDQGNSAWVKISQTIDFSFSFLGLKGDGRFIAVYSNYDFQPQFEKKSFTNEVLTFLPEANKKDSLYWRETRPVPLTGEEVDDYVRKDSLQELRKSKVYLDSLDRENNKLSLTSPLFGQGYRNSYKKWRVDYAGPLPGIKFNTVQGWNAEAGLSFYKWYEENDPRSFSASVNASYGLSDDRVRFRGRVSKYFGGTSRLRLTAFGGSRVTQFNNSAISPTINTISTLFFQRNYMKVYESHYAGVSAFGEIFNGLRASASVSFVQRNPLFNTTDYVTIPNDGVEYTSNNPLAPNDFTTGAIDRHNLIRSSVTAYITFGQKYMSYPNGKYNLFSNKYPSLTVTFENGAGASNSDYNFSQLRAQIYQSVNMGNKGDLRYRLKGGTFFNGDNISFADFQHFNGNQTRVGTTSSYTNVFNLLPYYALSTNQSFFEGHMEHNFKGWVLGKIPGINALNFNLVLGAHFLSTGNRKPYSELSVGLDNLGWGSFRLLRVDYVRSFGENQNFGAFVFGLKFLNLLD